MSIDTQSDGINIKELTAKEPEKMLKLPFNYEREVTSELWEKGKKELEEIWNSSSKVGYLGLLKDMLILFPQRRKEFEIPDAEQLLSTTIFGSAINIIHPSSVQEKSGEETSLDFLKSEIEFNLDSTNYWIVNKGSDIWDAFLTHPDMFYQIQEIKGLPETLLRFANYFKEKRNWINFSYLLLMRKIVGVDPSISEEDWEAMNDAFSKEEDVPKKFNFAALMKMLEAEEIQMTPQGLQVIMPDTDKPINEQTPVPEVRKF